MELTLERQVGSQVLVTCDNQASHTFDLLTLIPNEKGLPQPLDNPVAYGQVLYAAVFPSGTLAQRALEDSPERILLVTSDNDLDAIPWEYVYGPFGSEDSESFLILECHFVRGLPTDQRINPPTLNTDLHIVAVPSNPLSHQLEPLNIDGEWMRLKEIIQELKEYAITLERARPPTLERLGLLATGQQLCIIHFMGHGDQDGKEGAILCFEKDNGDLDIVTARDFMRQVRGTVFLVTLNTCVSATPGETYFSNLAAALIRQKTPYALGIRFRIPDEEALAFSRTFYSYLARGSSVEEAVYQVRLALSRNRQSQWTIGLPVIYTSLSAPAKGFISKPGTSEIKEHQPRIEVSVLPRAEGTFHGRIDELKELGRVLTSDKRPSILTIQGAGGQGKTALAREAVERFAYAWPGGVWATSLENLPSREQFVSDLARFLGLDTQKVTDPDEVERLVVAQLAPHRTLIVLDNAETLVEAVEANNEEAVRLAQFIRGQLPRPPVSLLTTSRSFLGWAGEIVYKLGGLAPEEGIRLFRQHAPQREKEIDWTPAWELCQKVEGHPFSLHLLGSAFNASPISFLSFVEEYTAYLLRTEDKYKGVDHRHRTFYTSIEISLQYLDAELRALLSGLWIFRGFFLPEVVIIIFDSEKGDSEYAPSQVRSYLHILWQRGLLTYKAAITDEGLLQFYRLPSATRTYVEHYLEQIYKPDEVMARFGLAYFQLANFLNHELDRSGNASIVVQQTREDLERGVEYVRGIQQGHYLYCLARIVHRLGYSRFALMLLERALEIAQGEDQALEYQVLNVMAGLYQAIGDLERALHLYEKILPLVREMRDPEVESVILHNTALMYQYAKNSQRALQFYKEALTIRRHLGNQARVAATLDNMAGLYQVLGDTQQALQSYEEALRLMYEEGDRAGAAATLNGIAYLCRDIGQCAEALTFFEQSIGLEQQIAHPAGEAAGLVGMALLLYQCLSRPQDAINKMEQAIAVLMQTDLSQDAAGHTIEKLQEMLQAMHAGATL